MSIEIHNKKFKVAKNTFPIYPGVAHAEPGDIVTWKAARRGCELVRESDGKTVKSFSPDKDGVYHFNYTGIITQVKSKGYILEITEVS